MIQVVDLVQVSPRYKLSAWLLTAGGPRQLSQAEVVDRA